MPQTPCDTAVFPLLAQPQTYQACGWDLTIDAARRAYWIDLFRRHFPVLLKEAITCEADDTSARQRAEQALDDFNQYLDAIEAEPGRFGRLDILCICKTREQALRRAAFDDPYRLAKKRENDTAMLLLPALLEELDAMSAEQRAAALIHNIFAGNIFDLGATQTLDLYAEGGGPDFHQTRAKLKGRPWLVDDMDAWLGRVIDGEPYRRAVLFVDNAGPDILLGMVPLARDLLQRGGHVIVTANTTPSLNDVTHDELVELMEAISDWDGPLRAAMDGGHLELVPSGNGAPLIDLKCVSPQLEEAVTREPVDLLVLEGMGRAIETNFDARFTCDTLKLAMIKDQGVAEVLGGELYDLMMRFEPINAAPT